MRFDMMSAIPNRRGVAPLFALLALLVAGTEAMAQAVITGKVVNEQGAPIQGVNVFIQNLMVGSQTSRLGTYTITLPPSQANGQTATLSVRFIGMTPSSRQITLAGTQTQDFTMKADPFRLDEVVVTGVAEATSSRKLTFSVARVSEEQLKEVPASSPAAALTGKISGVRVTIGSGNPGAAPTIRLRGSTNLGVGGSQPLIIMDGVITRNSIADIDANDIESIEVLKGAAAASFYGSQAANGVINITTKRGRGIADNSSQVTVRTEYGQSGLQRWVPLNQSHAFEVRADGSVNYERLTPGQVAANPYPSTGPNRWRNQLQEWIGSGQFYTTNVQLGVRRGQTNLNTSFTTDRNEGIMPLTTGQDRQNLRVNMDQGLGAKADFSLSATYGLVRNDYDPGSADGWFSLLQAPPDIDLRTPNGDDTVAFFPRLPTRYQGARGNPLYQLANEEYKLRRERILGAASLRYRPWDFLRLEASYGTDRLNTRNSTYQFRGYLGSGGTPTEGYLDRVASNNMADNASVSATATKLFFNNLLSTTRGQYLVEKTQNNFTSTSAQKLNVTAVPDLGAADPANLSANTTDIMSRTINYMISQALDLKDRYLVDVLYRRDGSSLFGPDARWSDFYRISGAYRISEDFPMPGVQELKIRAARGTAGLRPGFFDQYETYSVGGGRISKAQLGNRNLEPAIQTEDEYGVNATFLDRFDLEVVQANRTTRGAFLNVPLSLAASGGFGTQVQNAADVGAKTTEVQLQARVFDRGNFSYSIGLTGDRTKQKILKMNRAPFRVNALGLQGQDVFYYKEGEALGIIYGTKWVRSFAELQQNPANASANPADYVVNPLGFLVRANTRGTVGERPFVFVNAAGETQHKIGDVNPDLTFGFSNNLRWRGLSLYALFDGQRGGDVYNFTKQWMFQDLRHGDIDQGGKPENQRIAQTFYAAGLYNGLVASDYFVEDASFVKLRELSFGFTFGESALRSTGLSRLARGAKIALIGRNLFTWTDYSGFDPDVTSGNDFNFRIDGFRYPNFRTITGQLELTF